MNARRILPVIFFLCCFIAGGTGQSWVSTADDDHDEWIKLEIKEAFVSRQTHIDFRDSFSGAEFGWHVMVNGSRAYRGTRLYSTMYYPSIPDSTVRLILVEVDVLSDDIVSGVDLTGDAGRYEMNKNGDWALITRTVFRPDAKSGPDGRPDGARLITGDATDSVSFLDGDFTDYWRVPGGTMAMVFSSQLSLSRVDDSSRVLPASGGMKSVQLIIPSTEGCIFRVRAAVGGGINRYRILTAKGANAGAEMLNKAIAYLEGTPKLPTIFTASDMAHIFNEYDRDAAVKRCGSLQARIAKSPNLAEFCKTVNGEKQQ